MGNPYPAGREADAINARLQANPTALARLRELSAVNPLAHASPQDRIARDQETQQILGAPMPSGYAIGPDGLLHQTHEIRNAAAVLGGSAVGLGALGAATGGGAAAGSEAASTGATSGATAGGAVGGSAAGGLSIGGALSAIGSVAAGLENGRAQGRQAEANAANVSDQIDVDRAEAERKAAIDAITTAISQRQDARTAYDTNARNAVRGGALQGVQDVEISGLPAGVTMGHISGGLRPSAITNKEQIGQKLQEDAMRGLFNPDKPTELPAFHLPPRTATPQANALDTFLNILGPAAAGAGAIGNALRPPASLPPPPGNAASGNPNVMRGQTFNPNLYQVPGAFGGQR